jgi:peptide/nickel transport system permease protein
MAYLIRRLLLTIIVVFGVSIISFGLMFLNGDPAVVMLGSGADLMTQAQINEFRHARGFDRPWYVQYADFAAKAVRGDFGQSLQYYQPSLNVVADRFPATLELALLSLFLSIVLAIPLGVLSATRPNSIFDHISTLLALVGQSLPNFWLGILLMLFFGVTLRWLPISGRGDWHNLILPSVTLAAFPLARNMRLFRSSLLDVIHADYVRTARAKGLGDNAVMYKHAMRNALLPLVTMVGLQLGFTLGGSVIVETVFAWPGVGRVIVQAINQKDFPVVQAGVTLLALAFTFTNLLVDLLYARIDPRIRLGGK